ncbi:MAG: sensor domain-containing diguanylate cyclase [Betaproteobacteria bacterium HGW-Betaproteobacteria-13]|nr:MAG: sensor domain-containing diguanylate cyclase [Betaproteobacteria bacterium HGW-Betaproteobacteria-19]PKO81478.1 MAG: sensor domain-containing diguanylate cyclase [Betaproteobacteria bacterium HGW-Betaproteobacteria-13]
MKHVDLDSLFRSVVAQSLVAIYVIQDGRFRYVNQAFAAMFGYDSPTDVMDGAEMSALVSERDRGLVLSKVAQRLSGEVQTSHYTFAGLRRDGVEVQVEVHGSRAEFEGAPAVAGVCLDVTQRLEAELAARQAKGEMAQMLLDADQARKVLLSVLEDQRRADDRILELNTNLEQQLHYQQALIDNFPFLVWLKDRDGRFLAVNRRLAEACGERDPEAVKGRGDADLWPEDLARQYTDGDRQVMESGKSLSVEEQIRTSDGKRWIETYKAAVTDRSGDLLGTVGFARDITDRRRADEELRLADRVFNSTVEGVLVTDAKGCILTVNPAFETITGYRKDEVVGGNPRILKSGRHESEFYRDIWRSVNATGQWRGELWNRRKSGEIYPQWLTISVVRDSDELITHYVAVFSDISTLKVAQEKIDFLAYHDSLTRLPNRILLRDRLEHALMRARRDDGGLALLFFDLDRFKSVNDTLGHTVGDELLIDVGSRISRLIRSSDTLARLGGDEFVLLMEDETDVRQVTTVARKMLDIFSSPRTVGGHALTVTASIGIARYPDDGEDADTLLKHADLAMYEAKSQGRNTYQFFSQDLTSGALERLVMENALRGAVVRKELVLHYQPQIDFTGGGLAGVEALVRWQHPELGLVSPGRFIPLAEEMGIIGEIGEWVLNEACRQMVAWDTEGFEVPLIAVNLSARQIDRDQIVQITDSALRRSGLAADRLELEVTESMIMREPERALGVLEGLRALGVALAIDDFGTGYSSLAYLRRLPLNRLKVDQSFVNDIGCDANGEAIIRAVIALARNLGLRTVAEGVETQSQSEFLRTEGCDIGQGYLYDRPLPAASLRAGWGQGRKVAD